jgi:hypothetical protein
MDFSKVLLRHVFLSILLQNGAKMGSNIDEKVNQKAVYFVHRNFNEILRGCKAEEGWEPCE